ncbi:MAG: alpha/beta fold hydrolase, partial [Gemmataceae bacterium]
MQPAPKSRRRGRVALRWLVFLGVPYLLVVAVFKSFENRLVYPRMTAADGFRPPPARDVEDVTVTAADGTPIHGWWLPPEAGEANRAVLLCHGNGANLSYRGDLMLALRKHLGCGVFQFDYPGYGRSGGLPGEAGCYAAADAALGWMTEEKGIPPGEVIVYGESLGGGVAVDLASRHDCRAVVLASTFTSLPAAAGARFWFLPCRWMMSNR